MTSYLEVQVQMQIECSELIQLLTGLYTVKWCHELHNCYVAIVSDRRSAVLLVKGKLPKKSEEEREENETKEEIKMYVILFPVKFQVMVIQLSKIAKSKIANMIRKLAYNVIIEVVRKILVDIILSLIHDKEDKLQFAS